MIQNLPFRPFPGLSSPHVQTVLGSFTPHGESPPSLPFHVSLEDGDVLCCEISTPPYWNKEHKTVMMIHGLGGSHASTYMIRISYKLYQAGYKVIRVNLRGCGSGEGLTRLPYHGGTSRDLLKVIQTVKELFPFSPLVLLGFSLGGNIALKLLGELEEEANSLLQQTIAVCPPLNLAHTVEILKRPTHLIYHRYFLNSLLNQGQRWVQDRKIESIIDFDNSITAPLWGFQDAEDYYKKASCCSYVPRIQHPCNILFAADDPFINYRPALEMSLNPSVKMWISQQGGHMGFLGWAGKEHRYFWLDRLLLSWIHKNEGII